MILAKKTERRVKLLRAIMDDMKSHKMFSKKVSRSKDTESVIQKNIFLELEDNLEKYLQDYGFTETKSKKITEKFQWEQKTSTHVNNFSVFSTNHRPDAILNLDDFRIGIEIKKGDSGSSLRSGLGQCVLYGTEYDFVLYLFVDITPNQNIAKSVDGEREKLVIDGLWDNHNVLLDII